MKIAVYGAGGVGGYFGGRLAQAGADVHFIARGEHLDALQENGLQVKSVDGDFTVDVPATDDPADIGPCDYVLFTVKAYDTEAAAPGVLPLLHDDTAVITPQNGLGNERILAAEIGDDHVMGGVARIYSTIAEPGVIEHTGGPSTITFGELDGSRSDRAERFLEWCDRAEIDATLSEDIHADIWKKFVLICAYSGMTAAVRLPIGAIRSTPETWSMYRRIMEEVLTVGQSEGVAITNDSIETALAMTETLDAGLYSSLYYDLTHDNPMELEALHGEVVRRARDHDIQVPMNEAVYAILRPWAARNQRDNG